MGVKISIPHPKQMCFVHAADKTIVGQAANFAEFQELTAALYNERLHYHAEEDCYMATDAYDTVQFMCYFNEPAVDTGSPNTIMAYNVYDNHGNLIGMCDDYEGFIACAKHVLKNNDVSFPHNQDKSDFWCQDASNRVLCYAKPNMF